MNSTGLRLSPCGVPIVVANAMQSPVDRRGWSEVSAIILYIIINIVCRYSNITFNGLYKYLLGTVTVFEFDLARREFISIENSLD